MKRYNMTLREKFFESRHIFPTHSGEFMTVIDVVGKDFHAESFQDFGRAETDFARPDDPRCFTVQRDAQQPLQGEVIFTNPVERPMRFTIQRHYQGDCVFGNGLRRIR